MKQRLTRPGGRVLMVLLIGSLLTAFAGAGLVMAQDANPVRALPVQVTAGQQFDVTVTFTSPAAGFNAIGLSDIAPAGWTVAVNTAWTTPTAMTSHTPTADEAVYIWSGPAAAGTLFTAVYKVQVPAGAALDTYEFPGGELEYYIEGEGPYTQAIGGDYEIEVVASVIPPVGGTADPISRLPIVALWIAIGAAIIAGASLFVRHRRATR